MQGHAPADYRCPFCLYEQGGENDFVAQTHVVERTPETLTFVSPKWWPNNRGHVLVVRVEHFESLDDLPPRLAIPLQEATRRAALALKRASGCHGISQRQHNEPAGDQDVWHYHLHVYPRWENDRLYELEGRYVSRDEMDDHAERLRRAYER